MVGGPAEAERRDFQRGQCRGGGAMRDPNVDPGRKLSILFCVQFFTFLCVPCNSTFCGGGSLAKWRRQARPRRRRTKGNRTTNTSLQLFFFYFFKKQFQPTSSVGVPATLNILSSWSKTSLGKHRGEFVSFLKRSFSLSKFVDT